MIPAASTCSLCLIDVLASDPQPIMNRSRSRKYSSLRWMFACHCGKKWSCEKDISEQHYQFLMRNSLFCLASPTMGRTKGAGNVTPAQRKRRATTEAIRVA